MVLFNDKAVGEKVAELFPRLSSGGAMRTQRNTNIRGEGYQAGKSLNLAAGLEGGGNNYKRLG
jgi:hypothetical protein